MLTYMGLKIIENPMLTKTIEDWSRVRSPERARRRRRKHKQNIRIVTVPCDKFYMTNDTVICHPAMVRKLRKAFEDNQSKTPDPTSYKPAPEVRWPNELMDQTMRRGMHPFRAKNPIFRTDVI